MKNFFKKTVLAILMLSVFATVNPTNVLAETMNSDMESSDVASAVYESSEATPVYRLYHPGTGEHLYTPDAVEKNILYTTAGWTYEGIAWYAPTSGTPVYRLNNAALQNHLYTTDSNEIKVLTTSQGWTMDNNGQPLFYSGGSVSIYRLYNAKLSGMHHLTTDSNEYGVLPTYDWAQEGIALKATSVGTPSSVSVPGTYKTDYAQQLFDLINEYRVSKGLPAFTLDYSATSASNVRAFEISKVFGTYRPDSTRFSTALAEVGYENCTLAESIGKGYETPQAVMTALTTGSNGQYILDSEFTKIGVSCYYDPDKYAEYYWAIDYIGTY